ERRADVVRKAGQIALELPLTAKGLHPLLPRGVQLPVHRSRKLGEPAARRLHRKARVAVRVALAQTAGQTAQLPLVHKRSQSHARHPACKPREHDRHIPYTSFRGPTAAASATHTAIAAPNTSATWAGTASPASAVPSVEDSRPTPPEPSSA